jgi:hypothetical protein
MRKAAPFVAALVAASSIAGTADATATHGSPSITTLATALPETSHSGSSRSTVTPIRCWKTWQSVRDAILHHTTPAGCGKTAPPTPINAQGGEVQARPRDPRCRSASNRSQREKP